VSYSASVKAGSAEVVASGTVIALSGSDITVQVSGLGVSLSFVFRFVTELNEKQKPTDSRFQTEPLTSESLLIKLINLSGGLGQGNVEPILVGNLAGKPLKLNFRVFSLDKGDKTLHYTIYREVGP
jgi:hypothetical protein